MGAKTFFEKCFGVEFGPHSFKSGIPKVMVPGCVLMFLAVFFLVIGVLLCGVHAAYEVSRVDDTYEDYFLIAGIIGIVIGFVLALVGIGWCCHVRSHMQEEMAYYHDTKLTRSASIRSGIDVNEMASISHSSIRPSHRGVPPTVDDEREGYVYEDNWGGSITGSASYQDPNEVRLPQKQPPYRPNDAATRISNKLNRGVKDFHNFVQRNAGGSPKRAPYTDRLSKGTPQELGVDPEDPVDAEGNFDLSKTYKAPKPQYHGHPMGYEEGYEDTGGYANIPDTANAHLPRPDRALSAPKEQGPPAPTSRKGKKKRGQSEAVPAEVYEEPQEAHHANTEAYKYHQGRPLDSSVDSENENTTLVYNPKDGQWYYYYKGRPVSVYTGNNPERDAASGPKYRYINGKPVLVTKSTENLEQQGTEKSTMI